MLRFLCFTNSSVLRPVDPIRTALCRASAAAAPVPAAKKPSLSKPGRPNIVLVDAVRTPFLQSGTAFRNMISNDLQKAALLGFSFFFTFVHAFFLILLNFYCIWIKFRVPICQHNVWLNISLLSISCPTFSIVTGITSLLMRTHTKLNYSVLTDLKMFYRNSSTACFAALVDRTKVNMDEVGHIVCGTVIQECKTSNVAREAALTAGFSNKVPTKIAVVNFGDILTKVHLAHRISNVITTLPFERHYSQGLIV
ncbi:unnamed protein product [Gongylonema pulchrum]|uniref:Thiolase_N domain-containing protein n=1 Tax=Gongylonema pulchrum TaxID=637853 RepID=A0A183EG71_9BILA|nr:unnamed protein product [Gongylonema pulchrum]